MKKFSAQNSFALLFLSFFITTISFAKNPTKSTDPTLQSKVQQFTSQEKLLGFQENKGQMRDSEGDAASFVFFQAQVPNLNLWVTNTGLTYQFLKIKDNDLIKTEANEDEMNGEWHRVDMILKNADIKKENIITEGDITSGGNVSYYYGHCPNGIFNVKTYSKVTIKNIYEGIDWVLYTQNGINGSSIKQDFIVHPNADPNQIKMIYEGSGKFNVANNQIRFSNAIGELQEGKLFSYQGNENNEIISNYIVNKNTSLTNSGAGNLANEKQITQTKSTNATPQFSYEVSVETGAYNKNETLVIDPQIIWCTFMGGSSEYDAITTMDCNMSNGDVYAVGYVGSIEFPIVTPGGSYTQVLAAMRDGLILKFSNTGAAIWTTFYGGNNDDQLNGLAIDNLGDVVITGYTKSSDFPTLDPGAGAYYDAQLGTAGTSQDIFILKFNSSGVRFWSTFYGGNLSEQGFAVATDINNNILVTGHTNSSNMSMLNPGGGAYTQSYNLGLVTNFDDAFILKFNALGVRQWATFYGGNSWDYGHGVCADALGNVYFTGYTQSSNFPKLNPGGGAFYDGTLTSSIDAFIVKMNSSGVLLWATLLGGNSSDYGYAVITDYANNLILAGTSSSTGSFPALNPGNGAYFQATSSGSIDMFIQKFSPAGVQLWGTMYGGTQNDRVGGTNGAFDVLEVDTCNNIFMSFNTQSVDIPTQNTTFCASGFYDNTLGGTKDNFITKFNENGVRLWASYVGGDGDDWREAIALDADMNLYMGGEWTDQGGSLPTDATYPLANPGGGAYYDGTWNGGNDDAYIVKFTGLNPNLLKVETNSGGCNGCSGVAVVTVNCGDPSFSYVWSNGAQTLNTVNATDTLKNLCPGTYTVTVTSGCDKTLTATFSIGGTLGISPVVTSNGNLTINCINTSGTISANVTPVGSTYSWSGPGIVSGGNTASPTVNAGGTYTVIATYQGCTDTAIVTVTNDNIPPNVSTAGSSYVINCISSSDSITVSSSTPGVTYSWTGPGIVSGGNTTTPIVNAPGTYTVTVTNPVNGCTNTATITVTQNTITPNLTAGPPVTLTCALTSTTISASSTTNPVNYNWGGPGIVSGGTTSSPTINTPGTYTVSVTNPDNGCTNTATVIVSQNIIIPNVTAGGGFMLSCTTTSGSLTSNSTTPNVSFNWTGPNVVSGGTTPTPVVNAAGTYTVTVTDPINGCTNTATVVVTSDNSIPNLTAGAPFTLNCLILSGTINASSTTPNATFSWSGPGIVSGGNTNSPNINQPGSYVVTVTDPLTGCTAVSSVLVINDNAPPAITATGTSTITCTNTSDTISVTSSTTGVTYSWSGTGIVSGGSTSSPIINASGTYVVTVTNPSNGCTSTTSVTVGLNTTPPNAVAGLPITLTCVLTSAPINVTSSTTGATYNWSGPGIVSGGTTSSPTVNTPGTYTVIVTDPINGCTSTATVVANQNIVPPNVTANGTLTLTCTTTSSTIGATSTTPGATFSWSGPNIVSGATTASPTVNGVGTYTVVVTDPANGCTSTTTVTVNNNLVAPNVTAGASLTLHCNQTSSTISASSTIPGATYSWTGPGIVSGGNTNSPTVNAQGTYTVVVTDPANGCTSTTTVTVVNAPPPIATVSANVTIILGTNTQLFATGGPGYLWTPSTGLSCTTCDNPYASPNDTTTYCVTVTDQYGCSDSACVTVNVVDPCPPTNKDFPVPNVFTPNGDDKNDLFYLKDWNNECIIAFSVEIYDRWGLKMFESNGNNVFWDGRTSSGLETPAGTYYYILKVQRIRSEEKTYKGFIMLTR